MSPVADYPADITATEEWSALAEHFGIHDVDRRAGEHLVWRDIAQAVQELVRPVSQGEHVH